jgi:hypothetical protein
VSETAHHLPAERPPQQKTALVATGGKPTAIIPHSVEEMFRIAEAIHRSGLAPASQNSREKVMVAIMAGAELGMPPWQSVQSFAVIGNRPSIWGDAIPALLWSNGFKIKEWFEGTPYDDDFTAHCLIVRPDGTEIPGEFSVKDAKDAQLWTKTGPWQTAKKRMLKMRARAFGARDGAADVLRGMQIREEVEDYVMGQTALPRQGGGLREHLQTQQHQGPTSGFSQAHVEAELSEPAQDAEIEEIREDQTAPTGGDFDPNELPCERGGAQPGEPCKPDCDGGEDDDAEAEGLAGVSEAQDRLDAERAREEAAQAPSPEFATAALGALLDSGLVLSPEAAAGAATDASRPGGDPPFETPLADRAEAARENVARKRAEREAAAQRMAAEPAPAILWADQIEPRIDLYESVAEIDAFTADPDNGRYFQELEAADPARAKRLNAKIRGRRKALLGRESAP